LIELIDAAPRHVRRQQKALAPPVQARWAMRLPTRPGSGEDPPQIMRPTPDYNSNGCWEPG